MTNQNQVPSPPLFPHLPSFTTVEEKMDNADVESSFQEFINWLWYLTQHQEQRGHQLTSCPRPHQPSGTFQGFLEWVNQVPMQLLLPYQLWLPQLLNVLLPPLPLSNRRNNRSRMHSAVMNKSPRNSKMC